MSDIARRNRDPQAAEAAARIMRPRRRSNPVILRLVSAGLLCALVAPALAVGVGPQTWSVGGTARGFEGSRTGVSDVRAGSSHSLRLARSEKAIDLSSASDARSVEKIATSDNVLVADSGTVGIREYRPDGTVAWSYTVSNNGALVQPNHAQRVTTDHNGDSISASNAHTLITDRKARMVIEVDRDKRVVWRFGTGTSGTGSGQLTEPFSATRLPNGDTLICDYRSTGSRVIRVRSSDYDKNSSTLGYDSASIVWRYKTTAPRYAQWLGEGRVLITDARKHQVIEVDAQGDPKWSFGVEGKASESRTDTHRLSGPSYARRMSDGRTLIVDTGNDRILWVRSDGTISDVYGGASLDSPRWISVDPKTGRFYIADAGRDRIVNSGYKTFGRWVSNKLDLNTPGVSKWLTSMTLSADKPTGTSITVFYQLNGSGKYRKLTGLTFPADAKATFVRLQVNLRSSSANVTPVLRQATVGYSLTQPTAFGTSTGTGTGLTANPGAIELGSGTTTGTAAESGAGALWGSQATTGTGAPGIPGIPGSAGSAPGGTITGQLLQNVGGPDTGIGKGAGGWTVDPDTNPKLLSDPVGAAVAVTGLSAAFMTGIFSDALGRAARATLQAAVTLILSWRGA